LFVTILAAAIFFVSAQDLPGQALSPSPRWPNASKSSATQQLILPDAAESCSTACAAVSNIVPQRFARQTGIEETHPAIRPGVAAWFAVRCAVEGSAPGQTQTRRRGRDDQLTRAGDFACAS
jgi:hypothetical protein